MAQPVPQGWLDEHNSSHQSRHRVTWKAEDQCLASYTEHQRLARSHVDSPEVELDPEVEEYLLHNVVVTYTGTTSRDENIGLISKNGFELAPKFFAVISRDPIVGDAFRIRAQQRG
jgi:hypothetical protein